ncbi:hypothetical protein DCAR_0207648 [Daucus carota subsp. sativus]|uniref:Uncharacterized protein n=1 Tax=Daucus carota subsp. sativus TaxID=79200 RepID=A0A161X4R7_DAUCS|nr:PREDICTED: transmembrane protein 64 [Daucus carota subsp. sativus]WOG88413.1 hypothetical protein DCAR_0207648 [Daucus carota subsp. sativus]
MVSVVGVAHSSSRIEDPKGDYVNLREAQAQNADDDDANNCCDDGVGDTGLVITRSRCWLVWWWARLIILLVFAGLLIAVSFKWVVPFLMNKEIIPLLNWERKTFSKPVLAAIIFASVAVFPVILIPSTPSMWVAGMTFGYSLGFLIIITAVPIGVSLPYFIGTLFHRRMEDWLGRDPKKASVIRLAGEGNWYHQFKAVTLIRISPFPYIIFNYCAVATNVKYVPYLLGTLVGMVPEIFVAIYTGIMIKTLADASNDNHALSATQIIFNVLGFALSITTTVIVTMYAKRRLKGMQKEEELLV